MLYDSEFDLVISKRMGTYLVTKKVDGSYERVDLTRVKNCFGVAATVHEAAEEAAKIATGAWKAQAQAMVGAVGDDEEMLPADAASPARPQPAAPDLAPPEPPPSPGPSEYGVLVLADAAADPAAPAPDAASECFGSEL
mgnify:CR=1 FL=1